MKVLVIGSGGREHALCWKIAQSPLKPEIVSAPGNVGTALHGRNVAIQANDAERLIELCKKERFDLVVVGPEEPLCAGIADKLRAAGMRVFGPGAAGAKLEASKVFTKEVLERHRIPTASHRVFDRSGAAKSYLEACTTWPQVIKAEGLAAGKGVVICHDARTGCSTIDAIMEQKTLGSAGERIVIEECLVGEETSVMAITDGETILILEPVMDHKQVHDGDEGPNTGGMGVYSPPPTLTKRIQRQIEQRVLVPSVHALRREEMDFRGVLFVGLMLTDAGPKVLEYNVRFGDPEVQAIVRRLKSDLLPILIATADGKLSGIETPEWDPRVCIGVVGAAEGYPATVRKGDPVGGIDDAQAVPEVVVFHGGTARNARGDVVTSGGRVVCVTALGVDVAEARARAYQGIDQVRYEGKHFRRDIGVRESARKPAAPSEGDFDQGGDDRSSTRGAPRRPWRPVG